MPTACQNFRKKGVRIAYDSRFVLAGAGRRRRRPARRGSARVLARGSRVPRGQIVVPKDLFSLTGGSLATLRLPGSAVPDCSLGHAIVVIDTRSLIMVVRPEVLLMRKK